MQKHTLKNIIRHFQYNLTMFTNLSGILPLFVAVLTNVPPSLISGSPSDHHPSVSNSSSIAPSPLYVKHEPSSEEQHKALLHGILSSQSHHSPSSHIAAAAAILSYTGTNTATTTTGKSYSRLSIFLIHFFPRRHIVLSYVHLVRVYVLSSMYACHKENMAKKKAEKKLDIW